MSQLGINLVRLGVMWAGVEPERDQYSDDYIKNIENIIILGKKYNIYFLLDMHNDCYSEYFCGEGVP